MRAVVYTLGCKVNDVESGSIIRGLEELGFTVSRELEPADLYIVNTCAVTAEAERKSRQTVGKFIKCNPSAKIIVCGCASEKSPTAFLEKGEGVYAVTGAQRKNKVLEIVKNGLDERLGALIETEKTYEEMPLPECLKTRNFVKIQDGCNRFCSYCVIPYLRGRSRSRTLESAATEILQSIAKETVVTGIDVSEYKDEKGRDLADLMLAIKDADTRIRLGSLEVSLITDRFLSALKQVKRFAPQFHLSLQSGSNAVLKSMNRHYTREEYLSACKKIYEAFPNAAITTDIIVGFPTETEEDFLLSLKIVEEAGFAQVHAFPYSPREGTNAYKRYKELPFALKKERVERLLQAAAVQKRRYMEGFIGRELELVPENCFDGYTEGYSENYIRVYVQGNIGKDPTRVCVEGLFKDGVLARLV
ncbi:MAG: tRNA (N(6)-L-threonylcarbamoyladenosine(37)-C(2))-methylthiotransferase MtaB [Clostridiales bacterium]|nr:tRNA (N(6)-L-threonylcarbamoyladenosine(37)-C(2))-methylthiotransferase MtaB [Clostridiales bacterium]